MTVFFPYSGVETPLLLPPLVALAVSLLSSTGGLSGAFLLLPFQMSVLGFTTPAVSSTNLVYNIVAIPGGVWRYLREGRLSWPLTAVIIAGTTPGMALGCYLRVRYLLDPRSFKLFVGLVLAYISFRLLREAIGRAPAAQAEAATFEEKFREEARQERSSPDMPARPVMKTISFTFSRGEYDFWGERFSFSTPAMFLLALTVGVVAGAYGIGGGAIIAPICGTLFRLPVYTVAGASLLGTFLTSLAGVAFYSLNPAGEGLPTAPDWPLGFLFGAGGLAGVYLGARLQKHLPSRLIKLLLGAMIALVAVTYVTRYFLNGWG